MNCSQLINIILGDSGIIGQRKKTLILQGFRWLSRVRETSYINKKNIYNA